MVSDLGPTLWTRRNVSGVWQAAQDLTASNVSLRNFPVGPTGHAIVLWEDGSALHGRAYVPAGGWGNPIKLSNGTVSGGAAVTVDSRGNALAAWADDSATVIRYARFRARSGWATAQPLLHRCGRHRAGLAQEVEADANVQLFSAVLK